MLLKLTAAAALLMSLMLAQDASSSYAGQTWVGLLVSASCPAPAQRSPASKQSELTTTNRVTTPAVDSSGTRGESKVNESTEAERATRKDVPLTGDLNSQKTSQDAGWKQAKRQAASLGRSCDIGSDSKEFALLLPDGKMLRFTDLANAGIEKQLGPGKRHTIYRVQVVGKIENGKIALDSIQM
jgi:hypothetical protein